MKEKIQELTVVYPNMDQNPQFSDSLNKNHPAVVAYVKDLTDKIKELQEELKQNQWQPIETASKLGWILISDGNATKLAAYQSERWSEKPKPFFDIVGMRQMASRRFKPTHWMPLPEFKPTTKV
jgi:hypothetical protein